MPIFWGQGTRLNPIWGRKEKQKKIRRTAASSCPQAKTRTGKHESMIWRHTHTGEKKKKKEKEKEKEKRESTERVQTEAEAIVRHELLVNHDDPHRGCNIEQPCSDIKSSFPVCLACRIPIWFSNRRCHLPPHNTKCNSRCPSYPTFSSHYHGPTTTLTSILHQNKKKHTHTHTDPSAKYLMSSSSHQVETRELGDAKWKLYPPLFFS